MKAGSTLLFCMSSHAAERSGAVQQRLEERRGRQTKRLTGSMGLGHVLFPAVSTGTLLNVLSDGLASSSLTRASGKLPMNN